VLGVELFLLDDGWFGNKYPRVNDHAGLGDWQPKPLAFCRTGSPPAGRRGSQAAACVSASGWSLKW